MNIETVSTIKNTVPVLEEKGLQITEYFYQKLFCDYPELKNIFNAQNQKKGLQSSALSQAVLAYAKNIDHLERVLPVVEHIAQKHVSLGIQPEQYAIVGKVLLSSIQNVLALPDDHLVLKAWKEAYEILAGVFIEVEANIYQKQEKQLGGWNGFKPFFVDQIKQETPTVKSFYFKPEDNQILPTFQGGQFLGIKVCPQKQEFEQIRQYSLSHHQLFRITVKLENKGVVSQYFYQLCEGDKVEIRPPAGNFVLKNKKQKKILIAGGVGITPIMSMLQATLADQTPPKDVLFIQCSKSKAEEIFKQELSRLHTQFPFIHKRCISDLDNKDKETHTGWLDQTVLTNWMQENQFDANNTEVYFCGPRHFMSAILKHVKTIGFSESQTHYEIFGPSQAL